MQNFDYVLIRKCLVTSVACLLAMVTTLAFAATVDVVKTYKDEKGWKLLVNDQDFYIKGVVWSHSPRNENYTYNFWGESDAHIKKVLAQDFTLLQQAGVNAIRSFSTIPPKWISYINETYAIKTVINPLMGRYGFTLDGEWIANTDYSDPKTRETLKANVLADIRKYKDVPGVIMFALGNESNYGLSWSSFEIENLPVGEQQTERAKYLYSLYAEIITAGQAINDKHPITIVNGDIQYLGLIQEYGENWPLLGVNAYRGKTFSDMWQDVKAGPDRPILFFEFGSDAFNSREFREDQQAQAEYLKSQWQDMYSNSYGHGYGNSIGGFVFEWRDEWWKYKQTENLDKQDYNASWENGGYKFDWVRGENNMNEEWFGIARIGEMNDDGFYPSEPRLAYDVLKEVWKIDPYAQENTESIGQALATINMAGLASQRQAIDAQLGWQPEPQVITFTGGELRLDYLVKSYDTAHPDAGGERRKFDNGQMLFLDFAFQPMANLLGDVTFNLIGSASDSDFNFKYGDRVIDKDDPYIEMYDFKASYLGKGFDINAFYHVPRYHWGNEGDFFGLMREATDMEGQDIWNAKAPYGVEFVGKQTLDGLKVVAGPEVYWGANPKAIVKYRFGENKRYTFIHSHDLDQAEGGNSPSDTVARKNRQTTIQGKFDLGDDMELEIGGILSGAEKVGDEYDYIHNGRTYVDEIKDRDALGLKARLSFNAFGGAKAYVGLNYAGLVADAGEPLREFGTELPYAEAGNKKVLEAGARFSSGAYTFFPRLFYRDNLIASNPVIPPTIVWTRLYPGIAARNLDDDPFALLGNRAVRAAEIYVTYDPTPETFFYDWDNDQRENATFAYNLGLTVAKYPGSTDSALFFYREGNQNAAFGEGMEPDTLWLLKSKMVFNVDDNFKAIVKAEYGQQQPTGNPGSAIKFSSLEGKFIYNVSNILSAKYARNKWGPYDFQREFDVRYPKQYEMKFVKLLDKGLKEKHSSQVGVKVMYRTLDEHAPEFKDGLNHNMYEIQTFLNYKF